MSMSTEVWEARLLCRLIHIWGICARTFGFEGPTTVVSTVSSLQYKYKYWWLFIRYRVSELVSDFLTAHQHNQSINHKCCSECPIYSSETDSV